MSRLSAEEALERYMQDARDSGVSFKVLSSRRHFLRQLLSALRTVSQDGAGYRAATEETMRIMPEDNRAEFIIALREFYPYWNGDHVAERPAPPPAVATPVISPSAALPQAGEGRTAQGVALALQVMDSDAWSQVDLAALERQLMQMRSLARYQEELHKLGLSLRNIELRTRLMKLLLFTIRHEPQNTEVYRQGVDKVLALLPQQEKWPVFVSLAREFFYFLAQSPDAATKLQKQIDETQMQALLG